MAARGRAGGGEGRPRRAPRHGRPGHGDPDDARLLRRGLRRSRLEIKLFGGARLAPDHTAIGPRNADYVEGYLRAEGMAPVVRQLRGTLARRLLYVPSTGRAFLRELPAESARIAELETRLGHAMPHPRHGDVELFEPSKGG
ncbi:hypothetical protein [Muricoccus nepalensis]|uniref:hypothetical protein n=1 Tax=Muricoccus nepalensis TaxID=1854500 RepID=UPI001386950F|nr:hypothetical protein [Roseomonas nepalensis]